MENVLFKGTYRNLNQLEVLIKAAEMLGLNHLVRKLCELPELDGGAAVKVMVLFKEK